MTYEPFSVFWVAFAVSALVAKPIYSWLRSTVKQKIDPFAPEGHQLKQGTPTMGGLIVLVGALAGLVSLYVMGAPFQNTPFAKGLASDLPAILVLLIGFGLVGFIDDFVVPRAFKEKRGLGWKQKLLMEIAVAVGAFWLAHGTLDWGSMALCVFLVLFYCNAFNFSDGLDGLAGSLWVGLTAGLFLLGGGYTASMIAMMAILGGVVVFLFLNAPPAKVFMGDVGSLPLGAVLGFAVYRFIGPTEHTMVKGEHLLPVLIYSFVMIAEIVPVPLQVAYFKLTKGKRLFPATPIHHGFEKKGWPESRVTWTFALTQLLLGLAAASVLLLSPQ